MVDLASRVPTMADVARFLSPKWIARLGELVAGATPAELAEPLVIQNVITDAPVEVAGESGEVSYYVRLDPSGSTAGAGPAPDATVTFTQTYATAAAIAQGAQGAQAAFMGGDLRIGGQVNTLVKNQSAVAELDEVLAPLRADTEF